MGETQVTITVAAKIFGKGAPLFTDWQPHLVLPTDATGQTTLRALVAAVVAREVTAFHARQEGQHLTRILTEAQVQQGAAAGKITLGGQDVAAQPVDVPGAVDAALQAFADGLYYVFVDQHQVTTLDQPLTLHEGSHLLFVRLVALVGG